MKKTVFKLVMCFGVIGFLSACSGTMPVNYQAQSYIKLGKGNVNLRDFVYEPAKKENIAENQLENTAVGNIYIATDVSKFVKRATALELVKSGLDIVDSSRYTIDANILTFQTDDLGYSVDWNFSIRYILKKNNKVVIDKVYKSKEVKTGKFGMPADYIPSVNEIILDSIEQFMGDIKKKRVFNR